jgi:alpha-L-fucosidase
MAEDTFEVPEHMEWWTQARFGLFIHWGTYAAAARHEWVKSRERMPDEEYDRYFRHFDPDLYDPKAWARAAKEAGMKYFVVTSKHHEGFCLWDTRQTDYKAPSTPAGRDLLKPMVEAFRAEGLRVGFYYSLLDWHHPQYPVDRHHPMRDDEEFRAKAKDRDVSQYADYVYNQVEELLTEFGQVDVLFYDFSFPGEDGKGRDDWHSERLLELTRRLQPGIIINDRLDLNDVPGGWDYKTPEQFMVREWVKVDGRRVPWETCQTFSGSWGYYRDEYTWKSVEQLVKMLIDTVSKGGNLLLNVGPTGRGEFDERALDRLWGMGEWADQHGRSIYGCTQAPAGFQAPQDGRLTYNPETGRLYVHLFSWPVGEVHLPGMAGKVAYAQLLNDASELRPGGGHFQAEYAGGGGDLTLRLPVRKPDVAVPVIELFLK